MTVQFFFAVLYRGCTAAQIPNGIDTAQFTTGYAADSTCCCVCHVLSCPHNPFSLCASLCLTEQIDQMTLISGGVDHVFYKSQSRCCHVTDHLRVFVRVRTVHLCRDEGEDTVSKIDINTNEEVARYATWFTEGTLHVPHLDQQKDRLRCATITRPLGKMSVLNRFFTPQHLPVLLKIAPSGGTITTTSSISTVLSMRDTNGNGKIDLGEATDVRIKWGKEIGEPGEGTPGDVGALDARFAWIRAAFCGWACTRQHGTTEWIPTMDICSNPGEESQRPLTRPTVARWIIRDIFGALTGSSCNLSRSTNTVTNTVPYTVTRHDNQYPGIGYYSLSLFNGCGSTPSKVYLSEQLKGKTYIVSDPRTSSFINSPATIPQFNARSVAVDRDGNIVSGEWTTTDSIIRTTPLGVVLWDMRPPPLGSAFAYHGHFGALSSMTTMTCGWSTGRTTGSSV